MPFRKMKETADQINSIAIESRHTEVRSSLQQQLVTEPGWLVYSTPQETLSLIKKT